MGSGDEGAPRFSYVIVLVIGIMVLALIIIYSPPGHYSAYVIDGVQFIPASSFGLADTDPEITDPLRDQIYQSNIHLMIEIENTSYRWVRVVQYYRVNDEEFFKVETENTAPMSILDLVPGKVYRYHIKIVCDSDNETVRSLSFLDEDNHFSGSFKLKEGSPKKIKFFDEDRPLYEARDRQWVVYCGEMPRSGTRGEDVFLIELDVKDGSIVS